MKSQKHNQGELAELAVKIEKSIVESLDVMSSKSDLTKDEIVVIALKRFISSHADYMGASPKTE